LLADKVQRWARAATMAPRTSPRPKTARPWTSAPSRVARTLFRAFLSPHAKICRFSASSLLLLFLNQSLKLGLLAYFCDSDFFAGILTAWLF
jgi:hypothetical protein